MDKEKQDFISKIEKQAYDFIKEQNLIEKNDKVLVAVSGGKDSTVLMHILNKFFPGQIDTVTIDTQIKEYNELNLKNLKKICISLDLKLDILKLKEKTGYDLYELKKRLKKKGRDLNYCTICGILKRHLLNKYAKENKYDVIATGHNKDDIVQSILMNLLREKVDLLGSIGPVSGIKKDKRFVKRIKPLYKISEENIKRFSKIKEFPVYYKSCPLSTESYRRNLKHELNELEKKRPMVKTNILNFELNNIEKIQKEYFTDKEISACEICNQPAKNKICAACQLISNI